jgi:ATP-dependent exoDNAse (exonuclease V) beta subunit
MVAASVDAGRPIDAELARTVRTLVDVALTTPMADVLRRARCASWGCDALEVRVEMPFALATEDGLVRGRMDRVVLGLRGGRVERAEVVDWKTGARGVSGAELDQRIEPYRKQMAAYRAALAAMFGLAPERVTAVLAMVDRGELIEA